MLLAEGVLMVNVWLPVGSGAHLVQIFIIGLLSLGPADGRKLTDHPIQEGVPRLPKPWPSKGQEEETRWALGPRSKRGWRLMEGWRQGSGRTCGTCDSIPDCRVSLLKRISSVTSKTTSVSLTSRPVFPDLAS